MKKLVLASAAALVLAGATVSTGTVSANSYNNWNLTPEQRAKKLRELKLSRSKRSLVLSELERKRKSMARQTHEENLVFRKQFHTKTSNPSLY
ncbi:hypothetical protein KP748_04100 [Streptococcus equi subsp. zooepidemicus]|nr:hypothetical protein [Streptococcus equi subsp. zooepidemicus]